MSRLRGRGDQQPLKPRRHVLEEASGWLVEFTEGAMGVEAREDFTRWLRASPENVCAYLQISALWEDAPKLKEFLPIDVDELVARSAVNSNVVDWHPAARVRCADKTSGRAFRPTRAAVAAMALGCLVVGGTISAWLVTRGTYSTGVGEQRSITLADGSTLELNADSRVRVRMSREERDVALLQGQALFEVAKDPGRPFIVTSGGTRVRAVGTQFDVLSRHYATVVTVLEGRVAVSDSGSPQLSPVDPVPGRGDSGNAELVFAGEQLTIAAQDGRRDGTPVRPQPKRTDVAAATAWRQRQLVFAASPLSEVVEAYNRYHRKRLVLSDEAPADFHVSGVFSANDSASLIDFLRAQPHLEVRETARGFEILTRK